jgi:MED7 protein
VCPTIDSELSAIFSLFILRDSGLIAMEQPDVGTAWPAPPKYYLEARRRPPPPPPDGPISMYGIARAPLGETPPAAPPEKQLYELGSDDPCGELRKLNHTLLSTFLALLQTAQDTPSQCHVRVDEMRHLMLNMQHLINTFRPYQAREELISVAQAQVDAKRALLEQCRGAIAACAVSQDGEALESGSEEEEEEEERMAIDADADAIAAEVAERNSREELLRVAVGFDLR